MHSVHRLLRSGDVGIWEFCVFLGGKNIFNFRRVVYDGGLYFLGGGQFILCPFSHFELQGCKFLPATSSFSTCTFSGLIWMQGFKQILTLILNLNFLVQRAVSFHPQWAPKTNQLSIWLIQRALQPIHPVKPEHFV